jgi:CDP-paratose 2-epimerase
MRVLITGICGFVGSRLALTLREQAEGFSVFGVDNLARKGSELNRQALAAEGIEVIHGDVRCASDVSALPSADWVIDAAGNPSVLAGMEGKSSPRQLLETNLGGTVEMLEYCRRHGAGLVLLSTSRVYSIPALASLPLREEDAAFVLDCSRPLPAGVTAEGVGPEFTTAAPISLYGASKVASEVLALEYGSVFELPVWVNRCGVIAGAGQFGVADQGVLAYWINAHLRRCPLRYIGFNGIGYQSRDAFHPRDLAGLVLRQIRCGRKGGVRLYAAGGGAQRLFSLARLTAWCDERFGKWEISADSRSRPFDIPWFVTDFTLTARDFGWAPEHSLGDILEEIAAHAEREPGWLSLSGAL